MIDMQVGDLVRHIDKEKYGIIIQIVTPNIGRGTYFIILWTDSHYLDWIWNDMVEKVTK